MYTYNESQHNWDYVEINVNLTSFCVESDSLNFYFFWVYKLCDNFD